MPSPTPITTIAQLHALPDDGFRHELLQGEHVVTPAPGYAHQRILGLLYEWLARGLEPYPALIPFWSPADVTLGPATLVQPDLFVVRKQRRIRITSWDQIGTPALVIEVLSPSTASRDRGRKRRIYQEAGVAEYWIVDLDERVIERWTPGDQRPVTYDDTLQWTPPGTDEDVALDVVGLFRTALDE